MQMPEKSTAKNAVRVIYIVLGAFGVYLVWRYLLGCILPFAAAFVIAHLSRKAVLFFCTKFHFTRTFSVLCVTLFFFGILTGLISLFIHNVFHEFAQFSTFLQSGGLGEAISRLFDSINAFIVRFSSVLGDRLSSRFSALRQNIDQLLIDLFQRVFPKVLDWMLAFFRALPSIFLFTGTFLLSVFYFGSDYEKITGFVKAQLPEKAYTFIKNCKEQFFVTVFSVIRAYALLLCMTFIELWVGFSLIGIEYATLLAFVTALVDILPVFGTGTVLVPWGILEFLSGNFKNGLCILALYGIITVIRQVAEPKILGSSVGLHPLVTLMAMYFGIKLGGVGGLFVFPFIVIIIKNLNERGYIHLYKNPETPSLKRPKNKFI